jgi:hypothetical protein
VFPLLHIFVISSSANSVFTEPDSAVIEPSEYYVVY